MSPHHLSAFDCYVAGGFFLLTLLVGWRSTPRADAVRKYFLGGQTAPWWLILMAIVTTETSVLTVVSMPGTSFNPRGGNCGWLQLAFGYICGRVIVSLALLPGYFRDPPVSVYQMLRIHGSATAQTCAACLFLVTRALADGLRLYLAGLIISSITGFSMTAGIVVMGAGTLIYTIAGGMKAVLWTDVLQFAMKVLGGILLLVFVLTHLPKGFEELVEIGKAAHKFQILNLSVDPAEPLTIWSGLIGGCFVTLATHGTDQLIAQRCLSAKSLRHAQVAMALSGLIVFLLFALFLTVGVALYVLKVRGLFPVTDDINNDQVVPIAIGTLLPPGVAGLLLATLIASSMSTFAASLNSLSAVSISDIPWRRTSALTETQKLKGARVATLFWAALQFAVAFLAAGFQEQRSLISTVMSISALPLGVVLGLFAVTWFTKEISRTATLLGVLSGLTVIAILVGTNFFGKTWLGWPWYTALVAVTVTVTSLAATAQLRPR